MQGFEYFRYGLEDSYGFGISLIDEIEDGCLWHGQTDHGECCLKSPQGDRGRKFDRSIYVRARSRLHVNTEGHSDWERGTLHTVANDGSGLVARSLRMGSRTWW